jgi:hypothetical protein
VKMDVTGGFCEDGHYWRFVKMVVTGRFCKDGSYCRLL